MLMLLLIIALEAAYGLINSRSILSKESFALSPVSSNCRSLGLRKKNWHQSPLQAAIDTNNNNDDYFDIYDVVIIGSGPASCSLASLLTSSNQSSTPRVAVVSKYADKRWVPNYGCWTEEWHMLDQLYRERGVKGLMEQGVDVAWKDTDCFLGEVDSKGDENYRRVLGREYLRLSREGLKQIFYGNKNRKYAVIKEDVLGSAITTNIYGPANSITFHEHYTELTLKKTGTKLRAKIVVDATGAESKFTIREDRDKEGYQIAYGVECRVKGAGVTETHVGDYDRSKMTLFDFRTNYCNDSTNTKQKNAQHQPTFNYVMPLSKDVIFLEETSLVANPALSFQTCQERLTERMASQGVQITDILEEEYCYIPMGGGLPRPGQRLVPIGAAAGLVHASTGFQIGRALASNLDVAEQILQELENVKENSEEEFDPDAAAARILGRIWTSEAIRQRYFAVFGGDYFMTLTADQLKPFFAGFFKLDKTTWGSFLAGWKHLPGYELQNTWWKRLSWGVNALTKLPLALAVNMSVYMLTYALKDLKGASELLQSVTPIAGEPELYESRLVFREHRGGDVSAKEEALAMRCACDRCEDALEEQEAKKKSQEIVQQNR